MKRVVPVAAALLMLLPGTAGADQASVTDPEDGGSQRIWDIASITHSHERGARTDLLEHTVGFYDDVSNTSFDQGFTGSGLTLEFEFNKAKAGPERTAYFGRNADDSLYVAVAGRRGQVRGFANWFQPSPEELTIQFRKSLLKRGLDTYKWRVIAISGPPCEDTGAPADGCPDWTRWLRHQRP